MLQRSLLFVLAVLASTAATAHADKVAITPSLSDGTAATAICCVVNLDSEGVSTPVQIVSDAGATVVSYSVNVAAGGIGCVGFADPPTSYCRVLTSPKKVRVTFCMADLSNNCLSTVTAPTK